MTTTARPPQGRPRGRGPGVLLVAATCVVAAVALATLLGGLLVGSPGALGALVGGSIACCFFVLGSSLVGVATRIAPQSAMAMALMTYTLQVTLVALVFATIARSGAVGTTFSPGWLAGGVAAATVAWTVGQLVASLKARIPTYDIALPGPSQPQSRAREVGAP